MRKEMGLLSVVAPAYNEEDVIEEFVRRVCQTARNHTYDYELILVDDGSSDGTFFRLAALHQQLPQVKVVRLSRNFGQEAAVHAGLQFASGDAVIVLDSDLQDPPELIPELVRKWEQGYQVVVARRRSRSEKWSRRLATEAFHFVWRHLASVADAPGAGLYCLIDRRVADVLRAMPEYHRYFRGLRAYAGFARAEVFYDRADRAGKPRQTLSKLFRLAGDAIFSFSYAPLRISLLAGTAVSFLCLLYGAFLLLVRLLGLWVVPGFTTVAVAILLLGGLQLIALGIMGEYLGRIYEQVKQRPHFIVAQTLGLPSPVTGVNLPYATAPSFPGWSPLPTTTAVPSAPSTGEDTVPEEQP
jgi:glycosyltransferase involved in cell wall biosynthesis